MSYLLDTNVISALRRGRNGHAAVRRWYRDVEASELHLSALTFGEIRRGIELVRARDAAQASALEQWLHRLRRSFAGRILAIDDGTIDLWGQITARRPYPAIDALIAATAMRHGLTMVTRNVKDVGDIGVGILNPFE
ncbi:MAG: type II toxin-antitoxin system VapC family toxin [Alphaproteobacteria bacterium]